MGGDDYAVVDRRQGGMIVLNGELDNSPLSPYEIRVYLTIVKRGSYGSYDSVPSMADRCRMSERKVRESLKVLLARRLLTAHEKEGKPTVYHLTPVSEWDMSLVTPIESETGVVQTPVGSDRGFAQTPIESARGSVQTPIESETGVVQTPVGSDRGFAQTPIESARGPLSNVQGVSKCVYPKSPDSPDSVTSRDVTDGLFAEGEILPTPKRDDPEQMYMEAISLMSKLRDKKFRATTRVLRTFKTLCRDLRKSGPFGMDEVRALVEEASSAARKSKNDWFEPGLVLTRECWDRNSSGILARLAAPKEPTSSARFATREAFIANMGRPPASTAELRDWSAKQSQAKE